MATHQHRQAAMKRRWERKQQHQQQALRFIEEDDEEEASSYYNRASSSSATSTALQHLSSSNNDENEDALEVLANTVCVTKDGNYVTKEEFDFAMQAAQNALKAKTRANRVLTLQAKAAMQNAVMALKITEKEVRAAKALFFNRRLFSFFLSLSLSFGPFLSLFRVTPRRRRLTTALQSLLLIFFFFFFSSSARAVSNVANATGGFEKRSRFSYGDDD
jgi:hypothetical protein